MWLTIAPVSYRNTKSTTYGCAGAVSGLACSRCLPTCSTVVLASRALLMGLVMLMAGEGEEVIFALGFGLLLQLAIGPINKSVSTKRKRVWIRMSFGKCSILVYG
jgi:hypothetical protein